MEDNPKFPAKPSTHSSRRIPLDSKIIGMISGALNGISKCSGEGSVTLVVEHHTITEVNFLCSGVVKFSEDGASH
jgi:hypothetical protein